MHPYIFTGFYIDGLLYSYRYTVIWAVEGKTPAIRINDHAPGGISRAYCPDVDEHAKANVKVVQAILGSAAEMDGFISAQERHPECINAKENEGAESYKVLLRKEWPLIPIEYRIGPPDMPNVGTWVKAWETEDRIKEYPMGSRRLDK